MLVNVYFNSEAKPYPPRRFRGSLQNILKLLTLVSTGSQDQNHCLVLYRYYNFSFWVEMPEAEGSQRPEKCALRQWEVGKALFDEEEYHY